MKKIIAVSVLFVLIFGSKTFAGTAISNHVVVSSPDTIRPSSDLRWVVLASGNFGATIPEGLQTITLSNNGGTLQFQKTGGRITGVKHTEQTTTRVRFFTSVQYPYKLTPPEPPIEGGYFLTSDNKFSVCFSMVNNTYKVFLHRSAD